MTAGEDADLRPTADGRRSRFGWRGWAVPLVAAVALVALVVAVRSTSNRAPSGAASATIGTPSSAPSASPTTSEPTDPAAAPTSAYPELGDGSLFTVGGSSAVLGGGVASWSPSTS